MDSNRVFFESLITILPLLGFNREQYCKIDLSVDNEELKNYDITHAHECQKYVDKVLKRNKAQVAHGGYLEQRNLYAKAERFDGLEQRDIHLGIDFWCSAGTKVLAPLEGKLHSFANNADFGNYGPTLILEHSIRGFSFHTLYGHLSLESIKNGQVGMSFEQGDVIAGLGTPEVNVGYAPHLHFQIILDIGKYKGDYPGVCSQEDLPRYQKNCPSPNFLFNLA